MKQVTTPEILWQPQVPPSKEFSQNPKNPPRFPTTLYEQVLLLFVLGVQQKNTVCEMEWQTGRTQDSDVSGPRLDSHPGSEGILGKH